MVLGENAEEHGLGCDSRQILAPYIFTRIFTRASVLDMTQTASLEALAYMPRMPFPRPKNYAEAKAYLTDCLNTARETVAGYLSLAEMFVEFGDAEGARLALDMAAPYQAEIVRLAPSRHRA